MLVTLRIKGLIISVHYKHEYHLRVGCIQLVVTNEINIRVPFLDPGIKLLW